MGVSVDLARMVLAILVRAAAEVVAERAHADVTEACIAVLTAQVETLEDFWGRVDRLTLEMPA